MQRLKLAVPAIIILGGLTIPSTVSFGKVEYTKKEGAKCVVCHTKGKELNKVGECYGKAKTLKGCEDKS